MKFFYILFFGVITFSCQKVIDVDVTDMEPKLVIEANYDATNEIVTVNISKTRNVFGTSEIVRVSGASIEIINEVGDVEALEDLGEGKYELTNYAPTFLSSYQMRVDLDGVIYESSAFLPEVVPLDTLVSVFDPGSLFTSEGFVVFMGFQDPPGPNFYRAMRIVNGDTLENRGAQFLFDDSFSEGNYQEVPFFSSRYEVGDTVTVELRSYSEDAFRFYIDLFNIAGDNGQSAAPANPTSSWTNDAFGHFAAWGFSGRTIIIEE